MAQTPGRMKRAFWDTRLILGGPYPAIRTYRESYVMTGIKLIVDYSRPRQEKIADVEYAYVKDSVAENAIYFPHPRGEGKKEVYVDLFMFPLGSRSGEEVVKELNKLGYAPATIDELLVFGREDSCDDDLYCNVVALGSPAVSPDGKLLVPYIWGNRQERTLELLPLKRYWANHFSYLVLCR